MHILLDPEDYWCSVWFNSTYYHPPDNHQDKHSPFAPVGGELFKAILSWGEGVGQIKKLLHRHGLSNTIASYRAFILQVFICIRSTLKR